MTKIIDEPSTSPAGMGSRDALMLLGGIVVLIGAYFALCVALGIGEMYAGYFFLFYWGSIAEVSFPALRHVIPGAVFGVVLALLLKLLMASSFGPVTGGLIFIAILLPVIFCQLIGRFHSLVNPATMLFLTFATIVHVQAHASFGGIFASLALSIALFVPVVFVGLRPVARRAKPV